MMLILVEMMSRMCLWIKTSENEKGKDREGHNFLDDLWSLRMTSCPNSYVAV